MYSSCGGGGVVDGRFEAGVVVVTATVRVEQ